MYADSIASWLSSIKPATESAPKRRRVLLPSPVPSDMPHTTPNRKRPLSDDDVDIDETPRVGASSVPPPSESGSSLSRIS